VVKPGQEAGSTTALGGEQRGSQLRTGMTAENEFNDTQVTAMAAELNRYKNIRPARRSYFSSC